MRDPINVRLVLPWPTDHYSTESLSQMRMPTYLSILLLLLAVHSAGILCLHSSVWFLVTHETFYDCGAKQTFPYVVWRTKDTGCTDLIYLDTMSM